MIKRAYLLGIVILLTPFLYAADPTYAIANSQDWKDVYSTMLYASLKGISSDFLTTTSYGPILINGIPRENSLLIVSSSKSPYVYNYPDIINSKGFSSPEEITTKNANTELINNLPEINNFVIIGDSYGYNAIAVTPYAIQKNSWVFLASKINIAQIDSILSRKNINEILIYGYVDREVRDTLEKYNPKVIDTKDRFNDNIEIVKQFLKLKSTKQVLLTGGEFIEKELMLGSEPILFTGKENVPDQIKNYLKDSPLEIGILIGNDLIGTATNIKKSTGLNVMVKFARGARSQNQGVSAVEGLDLFPVPTPSINLTVESIKYNIANSELEVTYKSNSNIPIFIKGTITLDNKKVGDAEAIFIAPGNYKTIIYKLETSIENLKAQVYTLYGESAQALDRILQQTIDVAKIEVIDNCEIDLKSIKYNKQKKEFKINVKNSGQVACWINLEISNLKVGYEEITIGTETQTKIPAKKTKTITIQQELTAEDILNNKFVEVTAHFGEKQNSLVKTITKTLELKTELFGIIIYLIILVILVIVILFIIIFFLRRRKDEEGY